MQNSPATKQAPASAGLRLGELIGGLGLLGKRELADALKVSHETGLPLGRVLVMSGYLKDDMLAAVVDAQSMIREGLIDIGMAKKVLAVVKQKQCSLNQALVESGIDSEIKRSNLLGDLLMEAGYIDEKRLKLALEQSTATGLPLGRTLVLSGLIPEELLSIAINAQVLLRDSRVSRAQATQSLRSAFSRHVPIEVPLAEKGYYALPTRQSIRLGEILLAAGVLSEQELMTALEFGLANNKPVGEVLTDLRFIEEATISAALALQKMVAEQSLKLEEATFALSAIYRDGITLAEALDKNNPKDAQKSKSKNAATQTFPEFLQLTKNVTSDELRKAFEAVLLNPQMVAKILDVAGVIDKNILQEALKSYQLFKQGRLSIEHACVVLEFCRKNQVSVDDALRALNWQQLDQMQKPLSTREYDLNRWAEACRTAYAIYELGDLDQAEQMWAEILDRAEEIEITDVRHPRAKEVLAKIYEIQNRHNEALDLFLESLKAKRALFEENHFEIAATLNNVASLAYRINDLKLSEYYSRQYLLMLEVLSGPTHPNVASALDNLGLTCHLQKRYEEAAELYQRALDICTNTLGSEHPSTVRVMRKYAATLKALDKNEELSRLNGVVAGTISGSWKTLKLPTEDSLFANTSAN